MFFFPSVYATTMIQFNVGKNEFHVDFHFTLSVVMTHEMDRKQVENETL